MARYICPSCGSRYNGKKCRNCLYEHFTEEISHGAHTHEGEPLVIDAPARRPIKRKDPFGCEKRTRKQHPFAGLLVLLAIINALLPMIRNWGLELKAREERHIAAEPEPFLPENAFLLWEEGSIRIYADWENRAESNDYFTIYVENDYNDDLIVCSQDVIVNGYMVESSGVYCDADKNSATRSTFYFDGTDLADTGIEEVHSLSFRLGVYDEDYTCLFTTDTIVMPNTSADHQESAILGGTVLYEDGGIEVRYLGYSPDNYSPNDVSEGTLLFYLENSTDRCLQFYTMEASIADGSTELFFWKELLPQTKAVVRMYLYETDELGIDTLADMAPMTLRLDINDPDDPDFHIYTDPIEVPLD